MIVNKFLTPNEQMQFCVLTVFKNFDLNCNVIVIYQIYLGSHFYNWGHRKLTFELKSVRIIK